MRFVVHIVPSDMDRLPPVVQDQVGRQLMRKIPRERQRLENERQWLDQQERDLAEWARMLGKF